MASICCVVAATRSPSSEAVHDHYIVRNPCATTKLPRRSKPGHRYLTFDEVDALADAIDPRYRALVYTMVHTGIRSGEAAALNVSDVDFLKHTVTITRNATESAGRLAYGEPKTPASRRTIALDSDATALIAEHIATFGTAGEFQFSTSEQRPLRWTNLRRRQWASAVAVLDDPAPTPHDLRHTHAALSIAANVNMKSLQARMGHSSITLTLDLYGHLFDRHDEHIADALGEGFRQARNARQGRRDVIEFEPRVAVAVPGHQDLIG